MRIFSGLRVFVFFGVVLLFVGSVTDVHAQQHSLELGGGLGIDRLYQVNDTVETVFIAAHDPGLPAEGVTLTITHGGLTDVVISNDGITDFLGQVTVTGKIIADTGVYIQAEWPDRRLWARFEPPVVRDVTQEPYLEIVDMTGDEAGVTAGTELTVIFQAGYDGVGESGIPLSITATSNINITSPTPVLGTHMTGPGGVLIVKGTLLQANVPTHIEAFWEVSRTGGLSARADIPVGDDPAPLLIVVNSPDPKSPLKVGDTFTQEITIENRDSTGRSSLPLSAWQMNVAYNPLILEVVDVAEGDFLASDGIDTVFYADIRSKGRITVSQSRLGLASVGIVLHPGDIGTLLTIQFEVLAVPEEPLGIYNIQLLSDQGERISSYVVVSDYRVVTTHPSPATTTEAVFENYSHTFRHRDVHEHFPDVLRAFKNPEVQNVLNSVVIHHFVRDPEYIRAFSPDVDASIITLLTTDNGFRTLFEDEGFQGVLQEPAEIDELVRLIEAQPQREPRMLTIVSGDLQEGSPQTPLGNPLVVLVRDQDGDALSGVDVTFRVTRGDGRLSRTTARTGGTGRAETTLTLASESGIHQIEASVVGFSSLTQTFTAAAAAVCEVPSPLRPTTLSIVSGNNQSGEVGKPLAQPFVVGMLDQAGRPLQGTAVTFAVTAGNGRLSKTRETTDVYGQARTTLTLGSRAGRHSVMARAAGITQPQTFTATATAPPPPKEPEPVVPEQPSTAEPPLPPIPSLPVVYWIEEGAIFRLDGGNKQALVEPSDGWTVTSLAMDMKKNKLYWTERQTGKQIGRIWSGDLNDRNARELQSITAVPEGIVVDAENDRLYWTNGRGKIQSINGDGSNFKGNLIEGLGSPHHIALDGNTAWGDIYWTVDNEDGSWSIWRAPLVGNITKEEIVTGLDQLGGIAVGGDRVYWTEVKGNGGKIRSANKRNGSGVKILFSLPGSIPLGLAVDEAGRRLYWTDNGGNIRSLNLDKPIENEVVVRGSSDTPAVAIALGRSSSESIPASPAAPSTIAERSVESALLANYPNPFNPETWIPYQLSAAGDVSISIYSVNGHLVRRLELGHQVAGVYQRRSRAAYWDGRNGFGERVASGLYFYTLTADDFTATRKMLIRK